MRTRLDVIRTNMLQRCYNPKSPYYHRYGGRGIEVCKEWRQDSYAFKKWAKANGYADTLTLDRIENDGNYEPSNCRWVTPRENANNRSTCHFVTAFDETHSLAEWSEMLGISYNTLRKRAANGEDGEQLLRQPKREVACRG